MITLLKYLHLISSRSNRHSPLRPSLLSAVSVLEQNTRSGTAMTTGEWGRALTPIAYVLGTKGSEGGREGGTEGGPEGGTEGGREGG